MHIKVKPERLGNHFHITVYVAENRSATHANAGTLVLDPFQWDSFRLMMIRGSSASNLEFIVDGESR